jgi:hypothetical protein
VKYYASLVQFYTVYKLQRMAVPTVRLYLLCFASHRFRQINDNLIEAFIHLVDQYEQQAKLASEEAAVKAMSDTTANLQAAGQVLNLFLDPSIAGWTPFSKVRQQAFSLLDTTRFAQVSEYMRKIEFDKTDSSGRSTARCTQSSSSTCGICSRIWTSPAWLRMRRCSKGWRSCRKFCAMADRLVR